MEEKKWGHIENFKVGIKINMHMVPREKFSIALEYKNKVEI